MVGLRSSLFWIYFALSLPFWFVGAFTIFALAFPFDPRRRLLHRYSCWWGAHYIYVCPLWTMQVLGRNHLQAAGPCVIAPNHQSLGDILVLFGIHRHFKWVSKKSVFGVPFLGWNMRLNDYVPLQRGNPASIQRMMDHCARHLRAGSPVLMFPEGTRSKDGSLGTFKHGAFSLAMSAGVPVVPVAVTGTKDALPKHGLMLRQTANITVRILPAEQPREGEDAAAFGERVRLAIAAGMAQDLGVEPAQVLTPAQAGAR